MEKEKVVCYARVSTSSKDQTNSFENQKSFFEDYLSKINNYEFCGIYADRGLTGTSLTNRKQFEKMLYDAGLDKTTTKLTHKPIYEINDKRKPLFKRIFVKNSSRFARNMEVVSLLRELRRNGVYVHFLDLNITTENPDYEFILNFFLNFDQQESTDKSKKVRFGQAVSAKQGKIFTNKKLYGYTYIPDTMTLEIVPQEAKVIKLIFELYAKGLGMRRIIQYLTEHKIQTREGKEFSKSTISKILANEKYYGCNVRNKYDTGVVFYKNTYGKLRPEEEWIYHEDVIPAIITKELFEECKNIRDSKVSTINQKGINHGVSEFAGMIRCGKCGNTYVSNVDRGRHFFNCSYKKTKGINVCNNQNLSKKNLDKFLGLLAHELLPQYYSNQKENLLQILEDNKTKLLGRIDQVTDKEVEVLTMERNNLMSQKNRLVDLFIEGKYDKNHLDIKANQIDEQIDKLNKQINDLSKSNLQIHTDVEEIDRQIQMVKTIELKNDFTIDEAVDEIEYIVVCGTALYIQVKLAKFLDDKKSMSAGIYYDYDDENIDNEEYPYLDRM